MAATGECEQAEQLTNRDFSDEDELIRELEKDDDHLMDKMRERRVEQLKFEISRRQAEASKQFGSYDVITMEKQLMLLTTSTEKMVIHFAHKDFKKCAVMDKHLEVDVENVPFLVERMEIKVLPCVIMFLHGVGVDRDGDNFATWALEKRLAQSKVIELEKFNKDIFKFQDKQDSDEDWDE
ncbi:hypothetical protein HDV03_004286 [Kappamyces sp. JEL0829]|nr:hypothetical protein HDV03_004286 [Kappamyces sp. JEL0829]